MLKVTYTYYNLDKEDLETITTMVDDFNALRSCLEEDLGEEILTVEEWDEY
jgi:hypothetical protein